MAKKELNRKTTIPIKTSVAIVEWLLNNCTQDEIFFMADLARDRTRFKLLTSILTRLTDFNIHEVFYKEITSVEELAIFRASKRGEVAGLKAFSMACQAARKVIQDREDELESKREAA